QNQSVLKSAEAEIEQVRSQGRLTEEQDVTDLMKARYDVEEAKLDASKQEIVSRIEGEESRLKVADAEQKLREAEDKLKSDRASSPEPTTRCVDGPEGETDRSRLRVGKTATVRVEALPDREFTSRLAQISALATLDSSSSCPFPRNFDLELGFDQSDSRLRPG